MKHLLQSYLCATLLFFTPTHTQDTTEEINIDPENLAAFFIEHHHEIPCVKMVFAVIVADEETYNVRNWNDLITMTHNATELLETTSTPSSVALLTPLLYLLEKYKSQDNDALQAGLNIDILNTNLLDELQKNDTQIVHLPDTPSSVQHTFLENPMCVACAFTIEKSEITDPQDWIALLEETSSFIKNIYNQTNDLDIIEQISEFLFVLEDAQKENATLSTKIEILA